MNFRFTKKKTIVAAVVGVLWGIGSYSEGSDRYPEMNQIVLFLGSMLVAFVLVYVTWSLFKKKV